MDKFKSIVVNVALAAAVAIILIWGTALYRQHVQFEHGEKGKTTGNFPAAVAGYESAIHMYTPGSPLTEKSAQQLWQLAQIMETQGDTKRALVAYRSLRSSIYSIAWIYTPGKEWIDKCDARIAAILRQQQGR